MKSTHLSTRIMRDTPETVALRHSVRAFLAKALERGAFVPGVDTWNTAWDAKFSSELAQMGWIGMTLPKEYGGHGLSHIERFAVTDELLAAGAPVAAHWIADRQSGPSILRFGTEEQKQVYLPGIARGEITFAIGMSEPGSGSDLAAVRTRGEKVAGGWEITGSKVWTSGAHLADAFLLLARTEPLDTSHRHHGLTQFIVDLASPGIDIRPIRSMSGGSHFNEVFLDRVFVPDTRVLGEPGNGWKQVTSELTFERSGPERILSTFLLLSVLCDALAAARTNAKAEIGSKIARVAGLHTMSMSISGALARDEDPSTLASLVKVMGTDNEGDIVEIAHRLLAEEWYGREPGIGFIRDALLARPGFTLRGGTNEILRGVITRGLGMR